MPKQHYEKHYYAFGSPMESRTFAQEDYRFGFNGLDKDDDVSGTGNTYNTELRILDTRLGKWLSLDPMMAKFPWQSPYVSMDNNPISIIDPTGGEGTDWYKPSNSDKPVWIDNENRENFSKDGIEYNRYDTNPDGYYRYNAKGGGIYELKANGTSCWYITPSQQSLNNIVVNRFLGQMRNSSIIGIGTPNNFKSTNATSNTIDNYSNNIYPYLTIPFELAKLRFDAYVDNGLYLGADGNYKSYLDLKNYNPKLDFYKQQNLSKAFSYFRAIGTQLKIVLKAAPYIGLGIEAIRYNRGDITRHELWQSTTLTMIGFVPFFGPPVALSCAYLIKHPLPTSSFSSPLRTRENYNSYVK